MKVIQKFDIFGVDPAEKLHYGGVEKHKSFIGGVCSLCVFALFIFVCVVTAIPIYNKERPTF